MPTPHHPLSPPPTLLLPDLPPKTLVGIDLITFTSTANFYGIRNLPRGWHFLYTGTTELLSLRCGGWFYVAGSGGPTPTPASTSTSAPEILIWRWSAQTETLEPLRETDAQAAMRYKANLGRVWQMGGLFGYRSRVPGSAMGVRVVRGGEEGARQRAGGLNVDEDEEEEEEEGRKDWALLTDRFSPRLLTRVTGEPGVDVDGRLRWAVTSASTARCDSDDIPGLGPGGGLSSSGPGPSPGGEEVEMGKDQEREFSFLPVDLKMTWREGAIGRERTEAARDRSWALGDLIRRGSDFAGSGSGSEFPMGGAGGEVEGEAQVLGELQFTFLMGLTLMNYSCLQQWKRLLGLILTCRRAIVEREVFMRDVLRLLLLQLKRCDDVEGGLFDLDGDEGGEFLRKLLRGFRMALYEVLESDVKSEVRIEFERLEAWVKSEYDWELNREAVLRKGMLQLEDGEQVEMDIKEDDEDDETGEYAPVVVDLGDNSNDPSST